MPKEISNLLASVTLYYYKDVINYTHLFLTVKFFCKKDTKIVKILQKYEFYLS